MTHEHIQNCKLIEVKVHKKLGFLLIILNFIVVIVIQLKNRNGNKMYNVFNMVSKVKLTSVYD